MSKTTGKLAVIGDINVIKPFIPMGARYHVAIDSQDAEKALRRFADEGCAVILISDELFQDLEEVVNEFASSPLPGIASLPGATGQTPNSGSYLSSIVKKAIGVDIEA